VSALTGPPAVAEPLTTFQLPAAREAHRPPEHRGLTRDGVRLLVARPSGVVHERFRDLARHLRPGDVLVANTSATVPAALAARRAGDPGRRDAAVHVGGVLDDGRWIVEVRRRDRSGPHRDVVAGEVLEVDGDLRLTVVDSYPQPGRSGSRLWLAAPDRAVAATRHLARHGHPVTYAYAAGGLPLDDYRILLGRDPGSAEMPSAARPLTAGVLADLVARGIVVTTVTLHCGLSSADAGEPPAPERFAVPAATADIVTAATARGARVVALGTTVVRALESAADEGGRVGPASGWTSLVVDRTRPVRVVTGLVTGWHAPRASHLAMLEAVAGAELVRTAYDAALASGYLWHEFGDSCLLLP
jgi:S-adenosylmethionine:tRNA ribosyltransferase-isomerase